MIEVRFLKGDQDLGVDGPFYGVQMTYRTLRDEDGRPIASLTSEGTWIKESNGVEASDLVFEVVHE